MSRVVIVMLSVAALVPYHKSGLDIFDDIFVVKALGPDLRNEWEDGIEIRLECRCLQKYFHI
jgi:hypothetical protein